VDYVRTPIGKRRGAILSMCVGLGMGLVTIVKNENPK
jgi:hypothetical protein